MGMIRFKYLGSDPEIPDRSLREISFTYNEQSKQLRYERGGKRIFHMDVEELNLLFGILSIASDMTRDIRPVVPDHEIPLNSKYGKL